MDNVPPLSFEDEDLFAIPAAKAPRGPHTGRNAPGTSHKAAGLVEPHVGTIREQVEAFARAAGEQGFIDEDLIKLAGDERQGDRSYRPRRTELTDANVIVDSGRTQRNAKGHDCVIWVHRDYAFNPPAVVVPAKGVVDPRKAELKARGKATAEEMLKWSQSMSKEGRMMFASALKDAAEVMRLLSI